MARGLTIWMLAAAAGGLTAEAARVDFNRDLRPVLSDTCFRCHGFDANARKARLRLDVREDALKPAKSGAVPIVPGKPGESEVIHRLFSEDPEVVMPPPELHKPLTPEQKELFRRWIAEGAGYQEHWSFIAPERPVPPPVPADLRSRVRNPIDAFILARLEKSGLRPAREADKPALLRRVTLDLTGLPPTPAEVEVFVADGSAGAYEKAVDRLLVSGHYGERMAQDWLDAARFADSNGYQVDRDREMWAWRDWVVGAFNRNLRFDQFTLEQLAGDLLPNPTVEQRIATGFHRNHMINEEGGIIPEEFLAEYCADRVETTATIWLGLTFTCARCHDHKYDPVTQRDYYSLLAFFHNVPEKGVGDYGANIRRNTPPFLKVPSPELDAKLAGVQAGLDSASRQLTNLTASLASGVADWEKRARAAEPAWKDLTARRGNFGTNPVSVAISNNWVQMPARPSGTNVRVSLQAEASRLTALRFELSPGAGQGAEAPAKPAIAGLRLVHAALEGQAKKLIPLKAVALAGAVAPPDSSRILDQKAETVWSITLTNEAPVSTILLLDSPLTEEATRPDLELELDLATDDAAGPWQFRLRSTSLPGELLVSSELLAIFNKPVSDRTAEERQLLENFRQARSPEHVALQTRTGELRQQVDAADLAIPVTLVMAEMEQARPTYVLKRGAYDKPDERVRAATPRALPAMSPGLPMNRLGLARWLIDPANPLTARVTVNRLWQSVFGAGLVRTAEDFGSQGELPSHPELLDWLATEFIRAGWDVKAMMRLLVTSGTYRQDSRSTPELRAVDPENRLLARGPRYRLAAESIRDQALALSGLLVETTGGPSVKPYHPPGLYEQVVSGSSASTYVQDRGPSLYRRTLYTYWKRSVPNPALLLFDMPFRETCAVRRSRTTTPLQALDLLNDPTYVEAARALAQRLLREGGNSPEARVRFGFQLVTARRPAAKELEVLLAGLRRVVADFHQDPAGASELIKVGESKPDERLAAGELAAYTILASTLLNLDETVTRE